MDKVTTCVKYVELKKKKRVRPSRSITSKEEEKKKPRRAWKEGV